MHHEDEAVTGMATASDARAAMPPELCARLTDDGVLLVEGEDARSHLHSQFSSDIRVHDPRSSIVTSYSDPRGRLLAIPRILPRGEDAFALVLDREVLSGVADQLRKYALRARVRISDAGDDWRVVGIHGSSTARAVADHVGELPSTPGSHVLTPAGLSLVRVPDSVPRWLVCGPVDALDAVGSVLLSHAASTDEAVWRRLDIEAGLPRIRAATSAHFVAQMVNLDHLAAIDFRKGCYPGQEVIARTHYLGRIKRRMFILDGEPGPPPAAGDPVHRDGDGSAVGEIVDAAPVAAGSVALAVLRLEAADDGLRLGGPEGPPARARRPPCGLGDDA